MTKISLPHKAWQGLQEVMGPGLLPSPTLQGPHCCTALPVLGPPAFLPQFLAGLFLRSLLGVHLQRNEVSVPAPLCRPLREAAPTGPLEPRETAMAPSLGCWMGAHGCLCVGFRPQATVCRAALCPGHPPGGPGAAAVCGGQSTMSTLEGVPPFRTWRRASLHRMKLFYGCISWRLCF